MDLSSISSGYFGWLFNDPVATVIAIILAIIVGCSVIVFTWLHWRMRPGNSHDWVAVGAEQFKRNVSSYGYPEEYVAMTRILFRCDDHNGGEHFKTVSFDGSWTLDQVKTRSKY